MKTTFMETKSPMNATPFSKILAEMVEALPGALGAIFIDWEGEAVDQYSHLEPNEIRLIGAHWGIIFDHVRRVFTKLALDSPIELILRFHGQQVLIRKVTEEYLVMITMGEQANLGRALGLIHRAGTKLRAEM